MKYKLVVFDMDGTILNTLDDLLSAVNYAMEKSGYPLLTYNTLKGYVGNGIMKMLERSVPSGVENLDKVYKDFTEYYTEHCSDRTAPYEHIVEVISQIKKLGYKTAVVSNKDDYGVKALCEQFFKGLFDIEIGVRQGYNKKPSPDLVNIAFDYLGVTASQAVYIGDSDVDYLTAKNSKTDFIGVEWGFRDRQVLESLGAKNIASIPQDILKFI